MSYEADYREMHPEEFESKNNINKVRLEETEIRRRLHIGSISVDLNESDYRELVKIFSSAQNKLSGLH